MLFRALRGYYPRAHDGRFAPFDPVMVRLRRRFLPALAKNFVLLQILFLALFCWIFGSLYQQTSHTHNLTIAFVDYDEPDGALGHAFRAAYASLQDESFPTLAEYPASDFPDPASLDNAVCRTDFWAALSIAPGASARLRSAVQSPDAAAAHQRTALVGYTWNEARYPAIVDAAIASSLSTLSSAAKVAFATGNGSESINVTSPAVLAVWVNPWQLDNHNLQPTPQGSRAIYNTLVIVLILIQEFFYLGTLNGIYGQLKLWTTARPWPIAVVRLLNSVSYTMVGALCSTAAIWAFKAGWDVSGREFALNWLLLWLFAHANFQVLDVFTIWIPAGFVPMALISWIMLNVGSILLPLPLSPAFFRVGYVFPSHALYQALLDIWSHGCNPALPYALPTLFAWELCATVLSILGVYRRCHYGKLAQEAEESRFQERLDAAVEFERKKESEIVERLQGEKDGKSEATSSAKGSQPEAEAEREETRKELSQAIADTDARIRREAPRRPATGAGGGSMLAFDLPFPCHGSN